ncbi:MAG TPA: acyltransferase [Steroidobacteraceae bacterium]|nr:acyltransferase [Steroidobacteraceae bacterium]
MSGKADDSFGRSRQRLDGVDLLRGLAILAVLLNHVNMRLVLGHIHYGSALPPSLLALLVWNGQHGVQMFFAISGFLITSISLGRWADLSGVRVLDFYRLRFARIAPLLLLLLLVLATLDLARTENYVISAQSGGLGAALLAALTFRVNVLEARHGYLPGSWDVLWSLSVEETFYFFFPLLCRFLGGSKRLFIAVLLTFVALGPVARTVFSQGNEVWHEYSYLGGMDAIALGCLTALGLGALRLGRRGRWLSGLAGASMLALSLTLTISPLARAGLDMTVVAIGTCLAIAAFAESGWRAPVVFRPLTQLGERSYEIYLTHMFVVFALFQLFLRAGKPPEAVPLLFATVILAAGLIGALTARLYSEPLNRLLRARWRRVRVAVDSARPVHTLPEGY